tara:strand:- start:4315 stop:4590 length:276 start_codon:yes stop_codon:yes gene_type:complete
MLVRIVNNLYIPESVSFPIVEVAHDKSMHVLPTLFENSLPTCFVYLEGNITKLNVVSMTNYQTVLLNGIAVAVKVPINLYRFRLVDASVFV